MESKLIDAGSSGRYTSISSTKMHVIFSSDYQTEQRSPARERKPPDYLKDYVLN